MKIRIGFFAIALTFALIITHSFEALACFFAAFIHELGHIAAARISDVKFKEMRLSPFGAALIPSSSMGSFYNEIFICVAGPLINFLCVLFALLLPVSCDFLNLFILSSLFLGVLNLLPISSFDGGRILFAIIESHFSFRCARKVLCVSSFLLIFALWTLSLYLLIKTASSLSLFVFSCSLFAKLFVLSEV